MSHQRLPILHVVRVVGEVVVSDCRCGDWSSVVVVVQRIQTRRTAFAWSSEMLYRFLSELAENI